MTTASFSALVNGKYYTSNCYEDGYPDYVYGCLYNSSRAMASKIVRSGDFDYLADGGRPINPTNSDYAVNNTFQDLIDYLEIYDCSNHDYLYKDGTWYIMFIDGGECDLCPLEEYLIDIKKH